MSPLKEKEKKGLSEVDEAPVEQTRRKGKKREMDSRLGRD